MGVAGDGCRGGGVLRPPEVAAGGAVEADLDDDDGVAGIGVVVEGFFVAPPSRHIGTGSYFFSCRRIES